MKTRQLIMLAAVISLIAMITLGGCKKKEEPAAPVPTMEKMAGDTAKVVEGVEQTMCPVMGGKINKNIFIEHNGKKVYFCCQGCVEEFKKNPEKYMDKLPQFKN
ncbi:MAG: YHS domain-containing protein [Phycisphaerae bacterium]|nr:YHS domain-containing protein [Phycisphaerae bacterium]